ncbi:MAG: hypothetical protein IK131_04640 [Paludibacteraceae bacterium]|nr:hypothetical protein [Paludibacteraceae bacterium]
MRTILSSLIFLLALASFPAEAQTGLPLKRTLWVVGDSGSVIFSPYDLMADEALIQKNFTSAVMVKPAGENVSLITKKYSLKPHLKVVSDVGRVSFFGPRASSDVVTKINLDSICLPYVYRTLFTSNKYVGGVSLSGGVVSGIDKKVRTLKVTIYDNYNNKVLGERVFRLSPVVVHQYTTELHYTDINGNPQVYTDGTKNWIPADTTISAKVVVRNEYGESASVVKIQVWPFNSMACKIPEFDGDEFPSDSWLMREINRGGTYLMVPKVEREKECDLVAPLRVR